MQSTSSARGIFTKFFLKRSKLNKRLLIAHGTNVNLPAAFNTLFTVSMFALKEVHEDFSPLNIICASVASIISDLVTDNSRVEHCICDSVISFENGKKHR